MQFVRLQLWRRNLWRRGCCLTRRRVGSNLTARRRRTCTCFQLLPRNPGLRASQGRTTAEASRFSGSWRNPPGALWRVPRGHIYVASLRNGAAEDVGRHLPLPAGVRDDFGHPSSTKEEKEGSTGFLRLIDLGNLSISVIDLDLQNPQPETSIPSRYSLERTNVSFRKASSSDRTINKSLLGSVFVR